MSGWVRRSPRQVFEPRQTAKKWRVVAGVADETVGPELAIRIVHPCQVPWSIRCSPDWIPAYRDPPAPNRSSSSGRARHYEPIRLCSAFDHGQFHMPQLYDDRPIYGWWSIAYLLLVDASPSSPTPSFWSPTCPDTQPTSIPMDPSYKLWNSHSALLHREPCLLVNLLVLFRTFA